MLFDNFDLKDYIIASLKALKFDELMPVQQEVLNNIDNKKGLLVKSKTGSGKTHAFLIPIFNNLKEELDEVQAVIITPTKELAMQIYKCATHIASFCGKTIDIKLYSSGTDRERELAKLKNHNPQVVIATPGKLKDLAIEHNALKIYKAKYFVVDEADMTLESGYSEDVDKISYVLKNSKMMFFSATISDQMMVLIKKYMDNPIYIEVKDDEKLSINHYWIPIKYRDRYEVLLELLKSINPYLCIIFVNKKETAIDLSNKLKSLSYNVGEIHGDLLPRERKRFFNMANDLKFQYIVATDLAARGIDIDGVSHIINYELPYDFEFYVHRSGRTGRMFYSGDVYSLYSEIDDVYLDNLSKKGIVPTYKSIKDGMLADYKGRNTRKERVKPETLMDLKAKKFVKKPTKVTPGYKKKMKEKAESIKTSLYKAEGKKKYYRREK